MDHRPNKKPRTDDDGMPASAVAAPPSAESLEPPVKVLQLAENWGDGMLWKDMDHMTRLRSLTPRVIERHSPLTVKQRQQRSLAFITPWYYGMAMAPRSLSPALKDINSHVGNLFSLVVPKGQKV